MASRARPGRPPRVTQEDIARAALAIGLDLADIRNVAEALGMSGAGLYHHVGTRDELIELATAHALREMMSRAPARGSFQELLIFYAREFFELYASHPGIVVSAIEAPVGLSASTLPHIEALLAKGIADGLSAVRSYEVFARVMSGVMGAALAEAASRAFKDRESTFAGEIDMALREDAAASPLLITLARSGKMDDIDHFESVQMLIDGLLAETPATMP